MSKRTNERPVPSADGRYYYKAKAGNGYLNLKTPLSAVEAAEYDLITKAEFDAIQAEINPVVEPVEPVEPTAEELARQEKLNQIAHLKGELAKTDYQAIKYAEGWFTDEEYAEIKAQRQAWRDQINALEAELL